MIYCNKCARILDSDMDKCPYCGSVDESTPEQRDASVVYTAGTESASNGEPENTEEINTEEISIETIDIQSAKLDEMFGKTAERVSLAKDIPENAPNALEPLPNRPHEWQNDKVIVETSIISGEMGLAVKIGIMAGCVFLPVIGVIVAIVFMTRKERDSRKFGQLLLLVMVVELMLGCACCCALALINRASDLQYLLYRAMVYYG